MVDDLDEAENALGAAHLDEIGTQGGQREQLRSRATGCAGAMKPGRLGRETHSSTPESRTTAAATAATAATTAVVMLTTRFMSSTLGRRIRGTGVLRATPDQV
ncbi:hypothetical protein GCM10025881_24040 [Pseudolysinimonas kribbensis]|uniref:Uncharacterized protein n=1 Tax=Pseudolysinimonas kribbensis TaxID=433641 RepID=A0ABQ6K4M7_9MICO|nr:hypothetical protein GCM10025881_24040 [Pseudolysinimonas kribbensis]